MTDCKHEWYPVRVKEDCDTLKLHVTRVCRKCWKYQVVPSEWQR